MTTIKLMLIMAVTTYLVRMIPFTAMRKKIKDPYLRSVFYYMPYAILSAMTVPAIFYTTGDIVSSVAGTAVGVALALLGQPLTIVAAATSVVSLIVWFIR